MVNVEKVWSLVTVGAALLSIVVALGFKCMACHYEAEAFNKFTSGPKATLWDAVWCDLRVIPQSDTRAPDGKAREP